MTSYTGDDDSCVPVSFPTIDRVVAVTMVSSPTLKDVLTCKCKLKMSMEDIFTVRTGVSCKTRTCTPGGAVIAF